MAHTEPNCQEILDSARIRILQLEQDKAELEKRLEGAGKASFIWSEHAIQTEQDLVAAEREANTARGLLLAVQAALRSGSIAMLRHVGGDIETFLRGEEIA